MNDPATSKAITTGWILLAISLPLGLSLEALHALKVEVYLGSELRHEMWRLAHAHGSLLGILCLVFGALGERVTLEAARARVSLCLRVGAILMPLGFFLGGVMNSEGDPSLGILLVPVGGVALLVGLIVAARGSA